MKVQATMILYKWHYKIYIEVIWSIFILNHHIKISFHNEISHL